MATRRRLWEALRDKDCCASIGF